MRSLALAAVLSVLALSVASTAQTSVGTVTGVDKDSTGAAIPGAAVTITAPGATPLIRTSDANGAFTFEQVPIADYDVRATLNGFKEFAARISVKAGQTTRLQIVLQIGAITETVTVSAEPLSLQASI